MIRWYVEYRKKGKSFFMEDKEILRDFRKKIFTTAYPMKLAHLASAYSIVEIVYALYMKGILKFDANNPKWEERDRFILSKGHGSLAVYVALCYANIISEEVLSTFCKPGYSMGGEVNMLETEGVEATTGSLGHGLSFGVGVALAQKIKGSSAQTYVVVGNGEIEEGVIWEAVMSAYKFKLNNLTVILDDNKIQKMGFTSDTMRITSWDDKWKSFGWEVDYIYDGHNLEEVISVLSKPNITENPRVIIANTVKGKGVSIMENNANWHFKMPNKKELKVFMSELNISEEELNNAKSILIDLV